MDTYHIDTDKMEKAACFMFQSNDQPHAPQMFSQAGGTRGTQCECTLEEAYEGVKR